MIDEWQILAQNLICLSREAFQGQVALTWPWDEQKRQEIQQHLNLSKEALDFLDKLSQMVASRSKHYKTPTMRCTLIQDRVRATMLP